MCKVRSAKCLISAFFIAHSWTGADALAFPNGSAYSSTASNAEIVCHLLENTAGIDAGYIHTSETWKTIITCKHFGDVLVLKIYMSDRAGERFLGDLNLDDLIDVTIQVICPQMFVPPYTPLPECAVASTAPLAIDQWVATYLIEEARIGLSSEQK